MIGGPTDVVVEANIVRAAVAGREAAPARNGNGDRRAALAAAARFEPMAARRRRRCRPPLHHRPAPSSRHAPWPTTRHGTRRPSRSRRRCRAVRPADTLAGLAAELSQPAQPARVTQVEPAPAPQPAATATVAPPITPTDQSLAEMAQRLEAALRRPAPRRRWRSKAAHGPRPSVEARRSAPSRAQRNRLPKAPSPAQAAAGAAAATSRKRWPVCSAVPGKT